MSAAALADTPAERARLRHEAVELITTLWAHRERLSNRAYPLAPLREILGVISLFTPDDSRTWWGYRREDATEEQLFRAFTVLMPCLLLLHAAGTDRLPGHGDAEYEHLTEDERAVLDAVGAWFTLRNTPHKEGARKRVRFVSSDESDTGAEEETIDPPASDDAFESAIKAKALEAVVVLETGLAAVRKRLATDASQNDSGEAQHPGTAE